MYVCLADGEHVTVDTAKIRKGPVWRALESGAWTFEFSPSKVCAEERPCLRGVVTPSLLPLPIISAGWIKSPLDSHPKAL